MAPLERKKGARERPFLLCRFISLEALCDTVVWIMVAACPPKSGVANCRFVSVNLTGARGKFTPQAMDNCVSVQLFAAIAVIWLASRLRSVASATVVRTPYKLLSATSLNHTFP